MLRGEDAPAGGSGTVTAASAWRIRVWDSERRSRRMNQIGSRALTAQLADDLGWLEEHCRRQPDQAAHVGQLRLAGALVRNLVGPYLEGQPPTPLHVAVVGGAGAGKST